MALVVLVLAAGCADRDGGADPDASPIPTSARTEASPSPTPTNARTQATSSPTPSPTPSPGPVDPTTAASPDPTSAPPEGSTVLAAQFNAFVGAIGGPSECGLDADGLPYVGLVEASQLAIGAGVSVCFLGFDLVEPIQLDVEWPGGARTVDVVFTEGREHVDLRETPGPLRGWVNDYASSGDLPVYVQPGTPAGDWRLTATQGDLVAATDLVAGPGAEPMLQRNSWGANDQTVRFLVSGFPPGETPVGLYHLPDPTTAPGEVLPSDYVTATLERELGAVVADEDGAAVLEVDVAEVGPGRWCIETAATLDDESCEAPLGRP